MLRNEVILKCEKVVVDGGISVVVCILGYPTYLLLPFVIKNIQREVRMTVRSFLVTSY